MRVDNRDMTKEDPKKSAYNAFMSSLTQMPDKVSAEEDDGRGTQLSGLDLIAALIDGTVDLSDDADSGEDAVEDDEFRGASALEPRPTTKGRPDADVEDGGRKLDEVPVPESGAASIAPSVPTSGRMPQVDEVPAQLEQEQPGIDLGELTDMLSDYAKESSSGMEAEELADIALYGMEEDNREPQERFHYPDAAVRRSHTIEMPTPEEMGGFFSSYVEMEPPGKQDEPDEPPFDPTNPFGFILGQQEAPPHKERETSPAGTSSNVLQPEQLMTPDDDGLGLPGARDRNYFTPEDTPHVAFRVSGPYSEDGIATMEMFPASKGIGGYAIERLVKAKALKVTGASLFGTLSKDKAICSIEWDAYKGTLEASTAVIHGVGALSEVAFASFGKEIWDRVQRKGEEDRRYIEFLEMDGDEDFTCMIPPMKVINAVLDIEYLNKLWTLSLGRIDGNVELSWDEYDDDRGHRALVKRAAALFSGALYPFALRAGQDGASKGTKRNAAQKVGKWAKDKVAKDAMAPFAIDAQGRVRTLQR